VDGRLFHWNARGSACCGIGAAKRLIRDVRR
jgi:hypothetical protein